MTDIASRALRVSMALLAGVCGSVPAHAAAEAIPGRLLTCRLGHALNLDPSREQTLAEIQYEGAHDFSLFLPATERRSAPSPDGKDAPVSVDPATRIVSDPDGLRRGVPDGFAQVVDLWPERVEMVQVIRAPLLHFIVISPIDTARGTANLFMTTATDVASMNLKTVYQGPCKVAYVSRLAQK